MAGFALNYQRLARLISVGCDRLGQVCDDGGMTEDVWRRGYRFTSLWRGPVCGQAGHGHRHIDGATGMAEAQHLRDALAYLDAAVMGQPEVLLKHREGMFDA